MATDSKPKPQPYYPPGFVPPKAKAPVEPVVAEASNVAANQQPTAPKAEAPMLDAAGYAKFKADAKAMAAAMDAGPPMRPVGVFSPETAKAVQEATLAKYREPQATAVAQAGGPAKPNLAPSEQARTAAAEAKATAVADASKATLAAQAKPAEVKATAAADTKADKATPPAQTKVAKSEKANSAPKAERQEQAATPRSSFAQALHAEAKEHVRANSIVAAGVAQGLSPDVIRALAEHRLQGPAKDFAVAMTAGATDALDLSAKLAESQKVASALQSASTKASTPEQAQEIISARLQGDLAVAANSAVIAVADIEKAKLAALNEATPAAPIAAATPEHVSPAAPAAAPAVAQAVAPEASGATVYAVSPQEETAVTPLPQMAETAVGASDKAPVVEQSAVTASLEKAPIVEKSTMAAAAPEKAPIVEKSTVAAATPEKAPIVEMSSVAVATEKAPIVEKSTMAAATPQKAPIVEMSTTAKAQPESGASPSFADSMNKALHDAFSSVASKVQAAPSSLSSLVQENAAKASEALSGAVASVTEVIKSAAAQGAKVSLEEALASHMKDKGFDSQSIAAAGSLADTIRDSRHSREQGDAILVLHKNGAVGDPLASVVAAKDVPSIAVKGDSILALDTLEKIAANGMDSKAVKELRSAMPEAVVGQTDLELSQIHGEAKTALKGLEEATQQQEQPAKEAPEKVAQAEMAQSGGMSM